MFETGIRQFRMAMGMVWGRKMDPGNIARLVDDALATLAEFGEPGVGVRELVDGPFADPDERAELAERGVRRTARRLAEKSPFYARRFAAAGINPRRLDVAGLAQIPVTVKRELIEQRQRVLVQRCATPPGHQDHRNHRSGGRGVDVAIRAGAVVGDERAHRGAARRDPAHRHHAGSRQLTGHRGGASHRGDLPAGRRELPRPRRGAAGRGTGLAGRRGDPDVGQPELPGRTGRRRPATRPDRRRLPTAPDRLRRRNTVVHVARGGGRDVRRADQRRVRDDRGDAGLGHHLFPRPPAPRPQCRPGRTARPRPPANRPHPDRWPAW